MFDLNYFDKVREYIRYIEEDPYIHVCNTANQAKQYVRERMNIQNSYDKEFRCYVCEVYNIKYNGISEVFKK